MPYDINSLNTSLSSCPLKGYRVTSNIETHMDCYVMNGSDGRVIATVHANDNALNFTNYGSNVPTNGTKFTMYYDEYVKV